MSVVNKMLQDIDRRRAETGQGAPRPMAPASAPRRRRKRSLSTWLWLSAIGALVIIVIWYNREAAVNTPSLPVIAAAPVVALPPPPQPAAPVVATTAAPVMPAIVAPPAAVQETTVAELSPPPAAVVPPRRSETAHHAAAKAEALKMSTRLSDLTMTPMTPPIVAAAPSAAPASPSSATSAKPANADTSAPSIAIRHIAGEETVRAARALWNDGAHAAAIETLRQALTTAESQRDAAAMQPLGRELARLQVAENNPQAALDILKRLESRFIDDAEAWALRGNAYQRLGQHAEAADAYLGALRLRSGEARWMLGAAISLAALGKLDEARVWSDRAAERGPIPPSIAAYLKQLGVALP